MNKTKIKNFSIWARRNLIEVVAYRMRFLGIDENGIAPEMDGSTDKLKLYNMGTSKPAEVADRDISKRIRLANHIKDHENTSDYKTAYETVVEEIAYTWFNRLIAIRFMEVNDYLPSGVRVLSSESGKREPDIVTQAVEVAESQSFSISKEEIWKLKDENKLDELFRIMFIEQCKKLNEVLPELFDNSQDDYTKLLLPISFIDDDAFICHLVTDIDEADFNISEQGQVEIIGWLYQYYNSEKKDTVFEAMKKNVKVSKENIAAATQLFTPDWIVRYMVENSLGRLWVDGHADTSARSEWKYYLDEAEQTPEVQAQLAEIRAGRKDLTPEQIRFIDPCMGSGHILVYAFDVLMQIYLSVGYTERDAAQSIVCNNLWGLDLDKRAYQLAYFAVMMKARQFDRRFLTRGIKPNLSHFQDIPIVNYSLLDEPIKSFVQQFENADTYGSLISVQADDEIDKALDEFEGTLDLTFGHMEHLMQLYKILSQQYDVVCTNPPYMGAANMNIALKDYIATYFKDFKADFFSAFIVRCIKFAKSDGLLSFLTPYVWMFIQSYEMLRHEFYINRTIESLIQFEYSAFEEATVPICAFSLQNQHIKNKYGNYLRLTDFRGGMEVQRQKFLDVIQNNNSDYYYKSNSEKFSMISGMPVAYWVSDKILNTFVKYPPLGKIAAPRKGNSTSDNNRFLRLWYEVDKNKMNLHSTKIIREESMKKRWYPYNKGGGYRKWYGFNEYLVDWYDDAAEIRSIKTAVIANYQYFMKPGLTWSTLTSGNFSIRWFDEGYIFDNGGCCIFELGDKREYLCALLNSKVFSYIFGQLNPTLNFQSGEVAKFPIIYDDSNTIRALVSENVKLSKEEYDSFETSWDFKEHPFLAFRDDVSPLYDSCVPLSERLIPHIKSVKNQYGVEVSRADDERSRYSTIEAAYEKWEKYADNNFNKLKANEEELNHIFIKIYGLQDELTPEVEDKDITVRKADIARDCKSFVSYAVGCMLGRYSLDCEGLAYAGGEWNESKYKQIIPDDDNCLPITEEPFFEDDIVTQFEKFVSVAFGSKTLEENLSFIAENLGISGNGTAREKIRQYFLKDFFKDHCKIYQKRPIYWLFDTGKKHGFKALCYVHRWNVNTVGDVRIDYMHKLQRLYRNEITRLQEKIENGEEIAKSQKRLEKIKNQLKETEDYDAKIGMVVAARTEIDLDDGVKVNYEKVQLGSDGKKYQILATI